MPRIKLGVLFAALAGTIGTIAPAMAQTPAGPAFTYQGRLDDNGAPANGLYDIQFHLASGVSGANYLGFAQYFEDVSVVNGLFSLKVNCGSIYFNGDARFVEVSVRPGASTGAYTILTPRQELTPAPYATSLALPYYQTQSSASTLFPLDPYGTRN